MGNTTIIELNHDECQDIKDNPDKFVNQILEQLRLGNDSGKIEGGKIVAFFPRYDENKVYRAWINWKKKWIK